MTAEIVAKTLSLPPRGVAEVLRLLEGGATVPFIARYRKEASGGLDEVQIRAVAEEHTRFVEIEERRAAIRKSLEEQGKLDAELAKKLDACATKAELEDLYLPFRPKRRTRAGIARERGLEGLAELILKQPLDVRPHEAAAKYLSDEVPDVDAALAGARDIVAEVVAEESSIRALVRKTFVERGEVTSEAVKSKTKEPTKFEQYYDYREPARTIPSHRYLAVCRGEEEGVLRAGIEIEPEPIFLEIVRRMRGVPKSPFARELVDAIRDGYKRLLAPSIENEVRAQLKERSDRAAVDVFAENLRNLLLAPPLGGKPVIGVDPGLRTGCKCAAVDATGKFVENITIYLSQGDAAQERAAKDFSAFVAKYKPVAVGVGNGTGGRETESFLRKLLSGKDVIVVSVNEAGASVYSASDVARDEFPDLDVTVRGAISIARRLQDPLAELVKIDPKSIGVGQYQHDVDQKLLARKLDEVVESAVSSVGVDVNTASAQLLSFVAGLSANLAKRIVAHRSEKGAFADRRGLTKVSGFGPRTFEQAAGFLRIRGGTSPLDASAVHPERYDVVARMAADLGAKLQELVGNAALVDKIPLSKYIGPDLGEPTLKDIASELKKPGRDPRKSFEAPKFSEEITEISHLKSGMVLEGVVTNVTAFGAFVDVGVHQDGLVHVSQLADKFVKDPSEIVRAGDRLRVKVLDVDLARKRISLSAKKSVVG